MAIGSGAAASMIPERLLNGHAVLPSHGSRAGVSYLAAGSRRIPNSGDVHLVIVVKGRCRCRITFQIADVKRPLLA
eukprot:15445406-Alexandrium_andersonii.AAC.1